MKIGLLILLFIFSSFVKASSYEETFITQVVESCYNSSVVSEQIATDRDNGFTVEELQNVFINNAKSTVDLIYGFLLIEMIYDREKMTPKEFRSSVYSNCLKMYGLTLEK